MTWLVIVDCQNDFIDGSMAVPNAKTAINNIISFIKLHRDEAIRIAFTMDWHPENHCSFKEQGGPWPSHCVQGQKGAELDFSLRVAAAECPKYEIRVPKGEDASLEQYGAFEDLDIDDALMVDFRKNDVIVCGIAGDYCVKETISNLLKNEVKPKVFLKGVASIDDGTTIKNFIEEHNLEVVE